MSANNWSKCPRCLKVATAAKEAREERARRAYGKETEGEYHRLLAEVKKPLDVPDTLREDWELGITEDGEFFVIYRAECKDCGFNHYFKREEKLSVDTDKRGKG